MPVILLMLGLATQETDAYTPEACSAPNPTPQLIGGFTESCDSPHTRPRTLLHPGNSSSCKGQLSAATSPNKLFVQSWQEGGDHVKMLEHVLQYDSLRGERRLLVEGFAKWGYSVRD